MNIIIADLLNASTQGWPQLYNKWCSLEPNTPEWVKIMGRLQELAMKVCRTAAYKRDQEIQF